jgi:hydrogenase maturation protease
MGKKKILVLGIGNLIFRDEGIGIHAVEKLKTMKLPHDVELLDGGTLATSYMFIVEERSKVIVIFAMQAGNPPGTIFRMTEEEFYRIRKGQPRTIQEVEFEDALLTTHIMKTNPDEIIFIGIEPEDMGEKDFNQIMELSPTLQKKMPGIIEMVMKELIKTETNGNI